MDLYKVLRQRVRETELAEREVRDVRTDPRWSKNRELSNAWITARAEHLSALDDLQKCKERLTPVLAADMPLIQHTMLEEMQQIHALMIELVTIMRDK